MLLIRRQCNSGLMRVLVMIDMQIPYFILLLAWISISAVLMVFGIRPWDVAKSSAWLYFSGALLLVLPIAIIGLWGASHSMAGMCL